MGGFLDVLDTIAQPVSGLLSSGINYLSQKETNRANAQQNALNRDFTAQQSQLERDFNAAEALKSRDFNAVEAKKSRDFNAAEAQKQMDWQKEMWNLENEYIP